MNNRVEQNKIIVEIFNGQFDELMGGILDQFENTRCPMLVFADPFGIKGVPMDLMRRVVNRPLTELFMNVMFSTVNRWVKCPSYNELCNKFLGEENCEWKTTVLRGGNKVESFITYYVEKLTQGQEYLFHHKFGIKDKRNINIYQFVFVTGYFQAWTDVKGAMINNSQETETYVYSEFTDQKLSVNNKLSKAQIRERVIKKIKIKFNGKKASGRDIAYFVWKDTPYKFNLKVELKKDLKKFIKKKNSKFDEILFDFTNLDE